MRIVDEIQEYVEGKKESIRRRILRINNKRVREEHLQPGHTYRDRLSGELLKITTIGSQVQFDRNDLDDKSSISKDDAQLALDMGILEHDKHWCNACPNTRNV